MMIDCNDQLFQAAPAPPLEEVTVTSPIEEELQTINQTIQPAKKFSLFCRSEQVGRDLFDFIHSFFMT